MISGLRLEDFELSGPYGSEGAILEQVATNHFRMTLGSPPYQPTWTNRPQFMIMQNARGQVLRLDVVSPIAGGGAFRMNEYHYSWSYDGEYWYPIYFETEDKECNTFLFPVFTEDRVHFGHQVPLSYERLDQMYTTWQSNEHITVHEIGKSLCGRKLCRVEITDPASPYPREERWVHYVTNPHPGEHNAQWRTIGMIDWLLSDEAKEARQRCIGHFVVLMSVDGPSHGWYRVNQQGIDMNRSYLPKGADRYLQPHEAYVFQQDLENVMASEAPVTSLWNMHTWPGRIEPIMYAGPEISKEVADWTALKDVLAANDTLGQFKPLQLREIPTRLENWNGGPRHQFGITTFLCEGGSVLDTKEQNLASGRTIMKSVMAYYSGTKRV